MSRIVNRKRFIMGFSLIEAMTAACILSLGTVLIYESFFITLDSFGYYSNYLNIASWMDEKLLAAQDSLNRFGSSGSIETAGEFVNQNKKFRWDLAYNLVDRTQELYQIDLTLFWQEGKRKIRLSRNAYAIYEEKK